MDFQLSLHAKEEMRRRKIPPEFLEEVLRRPQLEEVMKVIYDPQVDVLRIILSGASIEESDEEKPGVVLDYDKDGNIVGLEILDASKRVENPRSFECAVAG